MRESIGTNVVAGEAQGASLARFDGKLLIVREKGRRFIRDQVRCGHSTVNRRENERLSEEENFTVTTTRSNRYFQ